MLKKLNSVNHIVLYFLGIEIFLYLLFLTLDISSSLFSLSVALKYFSILLCFFVCFLLPAPLPDHSFVSAALGFTLISDFFLLVLNSHYFFGVLSFCMVQILYYCRIRYAAGSFSFLSLLIRSVLTVLTLVSFQMLHILDPFTAAAAFYFLQLMLNAAESLLICRIRFSYLLFSLGLFLFLCCDLCVGLQNLPLIIPFAVPE